MEAVFCRQPDFLHPCNGPHDLYDGYGQSLVGSAQAREHDPRGHRSVSLIYVSGAPDLSWVVSDEFAFLFTVCPSAGKYSVLNGHTWVACLQMVPCLRNQNSLFAKLQSSIAYSCPAMGFETKH